MILETNITLPRDVKSLLQQILDANYEAYVVGGAVRDALLKKPSNDFDITTNATPEQICEIFKEYKTVLTGIHFGTVTVIINNNSYEITTYRSENGYSDSRHPDEVNFVTSLREDLSRRDFTINALACDIHGNVIDFYNGLVDIENKIIRCVGDPNKRLTEDGLRILRALRFSAQLNFKIEKMTSESMILNRQELDKISKERIRIELNKMFKAQNSIFLKDLLKKYEQIMITIIPELYETTKAIEEISHHDKCVYNHLCNVVGNIQTPDYLLRIAAFLHDIAKPETAKFDEKKQRITFFEHDIKGAEMVYNILTRLRYTKEEIEEVVLLIRYHNDPSKVNAKWIRRKLNRFNGNDVRLRKLLILKLADVRDHKYFRVWQYSKYNQLNVLIDQILQEKDCFSLKNMAINGYDVIELGFIGKEIGIALDLLLKMVIDKKIPNEREVLLAYLQKHKKRIKKESV